jgi:hypothetical protein
MVPMFVPDTLIAKIIAAVVTIVFLFLFVRAYLRNGRL